MRYSIRVSSIRYWAKWNNWLRLRLVGGASSWFGFFEDIGRSNLLWGKESLAEVWIGGAPRWSNQLKFLAFSRWCRLVCSCRPTKAALPAQLTINTLWLVRSTLLLAEGHPHLLCQSPQRFMLWPDWQWRSKICVISYEYHSDTEDWIRWACKHPIFKLSLYS